jgi:hypothetical protein
MMIAGDAHRMDCTCPDCDTLKRDMHDRKVAKLHAELEAAVRKHEGEWQERRMSLTIGEGEMFAALRKLDELKGGSDGSQRV